MVLILRVARGGLQIKRIAGLEPLARGVMPEEEVSIEIIARFPSSAAEQASASYVQTLIYPQSERGTRL
jgi:hypothetical protein